MHFTRTSAPLVNWTFKKSTLLHRLVLSIELGIVQTGKVDPARKFKCTTTAARAQNDTRIFLYHFWILWFNRFKIFFEWLYFLILIIKLVIYYLISNFKFWLTSFSWFYYNISFRLFLCSVAPPPSRALTLKNISISFCFPLLLIYFCYIQI